MTATSKQHLELHVLTRACTLAEGKTVSIYTDSHSVFGVVHDFGMLWKVWGAGENQIKNRNWDDPTSICSSHRLGACTFKTKFR